MNIVSVITSHLVEGVSQKMDSYVLVRDIEGIHVRVYIPFSAFFSENDFLRQAVFCI